MTNDTLDFTSEQFKELYNKLEGEPEFRIYFSNHSDEYIVIKSLAENTRWKGFGFISANGSSRLLLDYRYEQPESYNEILNYLFGKSGLDISHIKIEMGSDINSSSGTEPATMRNADEKADVRHGAGFQLATDAKKINSDITLDMLWWSEPRWVTDSEDRYAETGIL